MSMPQGVPRSMKAIHSCDIWLNFGDFHSKSYHLWMSFPPWRCFGRPAPCACACARVSGGNPRITRPQPHFVRRCSGQRSGAGPQAQSSQVRGTPRALRMRLRAGFGRQSKDCSFSASLRSALSCGHCSFRLISPRTEHPPQAAVRGSSSLHSA